MAARDKKSTMHFKSTPRTNVPQGRNGKHRKVVNQILADLDQTGTGTALKIPLDELSDTKERVRSALNRATRKNGHKVATSSDDQFLYIWNEG